MDQTIVPGRSGSGRPQFWQLARRCCQLAAAVDVAFFFLFHLLGSPILAWINVISVGMYMLAFWLLGTRHNGPAIVLIWLEVIIHAALGTLLIGWDSGFHYFLLMFIPALFAGMQRRKAWVAVGALWSFYVGLYALMWFVEPLQPISQGGLLGVFLFNLTVVFCMFSYLALFYVSTVSASQRALNRMATIDALTGLFNRRHLAELADKEIARHARHPDQLSFLLLDVDHFKQFNDKYGHDTGDRVLARVSTVLAQTLREQDFIGRWGGEEFLVVLPGTGLVQAIQTAERIRCAVETHSWVFEDLEVSVTVSVGVSQYRAGEDLSAVVARADLALYEGKRLGRNRVEVGAVEPV
ncbi:GGDEF domain-containing protein [Halopseudomonas sp.]|uniref:GGDEF domain-containing protein n=1 Tax=Halopseudomonas sp. TaxID=2901191 RepID=UPI001A405672|nr:diguanylate cyclase [Pseudomonas sp.]